MLLPALYAAARANPQHRFTFLTQPFLTSLLINPPANLEAMAIDTKREERSLWGLLRYAERLRAERFDYLVDLHSVLRTRVLRFCTSFLSPTRSLGLCKPRSGRHRLLAARPRDLTPLPSMLGLYVKVLREAGLTVPEPIEPIVLGEMSSFHRDALAPYFSGLRGGARFCLGIAPFASTEAKTYDPNQMQRLLALLAARGRYQIYLFGGLSEAEELERWAAAVGATSLAGKLGLHDELYAISQLDVMLSMDSANAHLAAMVGVPVLSVWCATHPAAGFGALGQTSERCLQPEGMPCRPCSIFGQVDRCVLGDMPCRRALSSEALAKQIDFFTQMRL